MRSILLFVLLSLHLNSFSQIKEYRTRRISQITSIGPFQMGDSIEKYSGWKISNVLIASEKTIYYHIDSHRIINGSEIKDIRLKFTDEKLVSVDFEYNSEIYNIFSYLNGCTYREFLHHTEIIFNTNSKYVMIAYIYNGSQSTKRKDRMILYELE